mmetsp:Transcript_17584/g.54970  ORF Transcript_17584/g.54970 Transcript_17584/m.54970 type:complete len:630 (-) Transcript_17584:32-1921(-)
MNISRVGMPAVKMQDAGQGFRTSDERMVGQVTAWPCALGLASTWDESLVGEFASAAAAEFAAKGANVVLGPAVNVHRVARGGRNAEYLSGEDPVLGARLVGPWVAGFESRGILTTVKHYVLNNQETNRSSYSAVAEASAAREAYLPPFRAAAAAGCASAMCSYNRVNGTYSCSNAGSLAELRLRGGFVVSDWGATHETAVEKGLDVDMPGSDGWYSPSRLAEVPADAIDQAVARVLRPLSRLDRAGCAPGPECAALLYGVNASTPAHRRLAERIATNATLLLKNTILPLDETTRLGVVGSACDAPNDVDDLFASNDKGNYYVIGGSGRVVPQAVTTVLQGLEARFSSVASSRSDDVDAALRLARAVDVLVACGGALSAEGADRDSLSLDQEQFLRDVARRSPVPVVVVALAPGVVLLPFKDDAAAVLVSFFGGQATGAAVANLVSGSAVPTAKSPVTFPLSERDTVAPCRASTCYYDEGLFVGYKALADTDVAFCFGHGLSFTVFDFAWRAPPRLLGGPRSLAFSVRVANAGDAYPGVETVQIYVAYPPAAGEPPLQLKAFKKTPLLQPNGGNATLTFDLALDALRVYRHDAWILPAGTYHLHVAASSRDLRLSANFSLPDASLASPLR